jgi:hypothetical protein
MSRQLASAIDIDAGPARVWQVLTDLGAYPEWNPFIVRAEGRVQPGARLTLRMQPATGRATTVRPTVLEATEGSRLRWRGRLVVPGLMDAEHVFTIEPRDGGRVRLRQDERFSGVLVPLVARVLERGTLPAFLAMNEALKRRVEETTSLRS